MRRVKHWCERTCIHVARILYVLRMHTVAKWIRIVRTSPAGASFVHTVVRDQNTQSIRNVRSQLGTVASVVLCFGKFKIQGSYIVVIRTMLKRVTSQPKRRVLPNR